MIQSLAKAVEELKTYDGPEDETLSKKLLDLFNKQNFSLKTIEAAFDDYKKQRNRLAMEILPDEFLSAGVKDLSLDDGRRVVVSEKIKASVSGKNYERAKKEFVDIFCAEQGIDKTEAQLLVDSFCKTNITAPKSEKIIEALQNIGAQFDEKTSIHPSTLKKIIKERLGAGQKIPESISYYCYKEAAIK